MLATGTFRYSPTLGNGSLQRRDGGSTRWWLIIECDAELGRYLRHLYALGHRRTRALQSPLWGTHISVIRGEPPLNAAAWGHLDGATVAFDYAPQIQETQGYAWCAVTCAPALALREELGLPSEPSPPLHLSIGNQRGV